MYINMKYLLNNELVIIVDLLAFIVLLLLLIVIVWIVKRNNEEKIRKYNEDKNLYKDFLDYEGGNSHESITTDSTV